MMKYRQRYRPTEMTKAIPTIHKAGTMIAETENFPLAMMSTACFTKRGINT